MKNLFIFIIFIFVFVFIFVRSAIVQSVDDIIDQYIDSCGGIDKFHSVTSISCEGTRKMMGNGVLVKLKKVQGKLFRADFEFEENMGFTIVTPTNGWSYISSHSEKVESIPLERLKYLQAELDIAGPLIDYKSKGYQASLLGKEIINDNVCFKIQLTAANGKESFYFIDTKTSLLLQSRQLIKSTDPFADKEMKEIITSYNDYKYFNGLLLPQTIITQSDDMNNDSITFNKIEINIPVEEKWFLPEILKGT